MQFMQQRCYMHNLRHTQKCLCHHILYQLHLPDIVQGLLHVERIPITHTEDGQGMSD